MQLRSCRNRTLLAERSQLIATACLLACLLAAKFNAHLGQQSCSLWHAWLACSGGATGVPCVSIQQTMHQPQASCTRAAALLLRRC
jgi:hypothetical protein